MQACRRGLFAARALLIMSAAAGVAACTVVRVDGPAEVSRVYTGILKVAPAEGSAMVAYRTRGLGVVPGRNGLTIGYASETAVALGADDDCRIVLFEPDAETVSQLASLLRGLVPEGQICNVKG
jgi:hypothetical protein